MATTRTAQQIADAAQKRAASVAARKANGGLTVRQARAAAKAAKAGQPFVPPTPKPAPAWTPRPARGRRRRVHFHAAPAGPAVPVFSTPKPNYRALKLAALVALEATFVQKLAETGITVEIRDGYAKYKKLKALAMSPASTPELQNEADGALRMATAQMVKLVF